MHMLHHIVVPYIVNAYTPLVNRSHICCALIQDVNESIVIKLFAFLVINNYFSFWCLSVVENTNISNWRSYVGDLYDL